MRKKTAMPVEIGRRIRDLRKAAGLTQQGLAEKASLNVKYLGEVENGHRDVRLSTLARIGKALGEDAAALFRFTEHDVTLGEVEKMLKGRDEAFRAHVVRLVREVLLLVEAAK